jgi:hypothetical protein
MFPQDPTLPHTASFPPPSIKQTKRRFNLPCPCRTPPSSNPISLKVLAAIATSFAALSFLRSATAAPSYFACNFAGVHCTLRTSPATAAGVTDRLWSVEDLVALWGGDEQLRAESAA